MQVFLRLRPLQDQPEPSNIEVNSSASVTLLPPPPAANGRSADRSARTFTFHRVFESDASQTEVYEVAAKPLVDRMCDGHRGLLFAYGVTNAGKTYTILGDNQNEGILPRCLRRIISLVECHNSTRLDTTLRDVDGADCTRGLPESCRSARVSHHVCVPLWFFIRPGAEPT